MLVSFAAGLSCPTVNMSILAGILASNVCCLSSVAWRGDKMTQPDIPPRAYIDPVRRDGKVLVTFVFPLSGRKIKKLIPVAQVQEKTKDYSVIYTLKRRGK